MKKVYVTFQENHILILIKLKKKFVGQLDLSCKVKKKTKKTKKLDPQTLID